MTEELLRLICLRCLGTGSLHSRASNPRWEGERITYTETHRPCDLCGGDGINHGRLLEPTQ